MNWLLDTNVISQETVERPDARAFEFLLALPREQAYLSVVNLMEIRDGIERLPEGTHKRAGLELWLTRRLPKQFAGRILPVSVEVADVAGRMLAAERAAGRTPDKADVLLAATARYFGFGVATLNRVHFEPLGAVLADF